MKILKLTFFCLGLTASGFAATITCLTNNSGVCPTLASEIRVTGSGANLIIQNNGPLSSAIDVIYFDPTPDNAIMGIVIGAHMGTVSFHNGGSPSNLPAGNNANPSFSSAFNISADNGPQNAYRINPGESLTVSATGGNLGDLFNNGVVRVGMHVQSIGGGDGQSESLLAVGTTVAPEPATWSFVLGGIALAAIGRLKIRRP
jgi:hypothetical protein